MTQVGLIIATMANDHSFPDDSSDDDDDDGYEDETASVNFDRLFIIFVLICSLCCTVGAMICDILCLIGHFITNKVINSQAFRALVCS